MPIVVRLLRAVESRGILSKTEIASLTQDPDRFHLEERRIVDDAAADERTRAGRQHVRAREERTAHRSPRIPPASSLECATPASPPIARITLMKFC